MKFVRKHINLRLFWFLMALHILNLSVDSPDPQPNYIPEDLSYNDMESIVEIVLEELLGIENAVPEQEDDDTNNSLMVKLNFQPVLCQERSLSEFMFASDDIAVRHSIFFYHDAYAEQFHPEIIPPPPKV
ncbi:hypothetical protein [Maribacter thermophilus]|uniref:hypothetical protein n=1 Tax=Maribacter thermophilus TaxID=1197874 RepID=UPI00069C84C7|nr:hypothetical protein [Maribacter thermophilus]